MKKTQAIIVVIAILASVLIGFGAGHVAGGHAPSKLDWTPATVATSTPIADDDSSGVSADSIPLSGG